MLSHFSRVRLFETQWTIAPTRLLCPWDSPGKNSGVGCPALPQGIFLPSSRGSSWPRDGTCIESASCNGRGVLQSYCHLGSLQKLKTEQQFQPLAFLHFLFVFFWWTLFFSNLLAKKHFKCYFYLFLFFFKFCIEVQAMRINALKCSATENSWEPLGQQGDQSSPS